jgi:membrane-bound ClpP family serine protease
MSEFLIGIGGAGAVISQFAIMYGDKLPYRKMLNPYLLTILFISYALAFVGVVMLAFD